MIIDNLEHYCYYQRNVPELWDAFRFAERVQRENLPVGKYKLGKNFAFVQEGNTRSFDEADFETHNEYMDVQILLEGSEVMEYANKDELTTKVPYNEKDDIEWLYGKGDRIHMKPGMFYLVYPDDGHKPCCHDKVSTYYRKVVVKIKIDKLLHRVNVCKKNDNKKWIY